MKVETIDLGDTVVCDLCYGDYTKADDEGGFLFNTKAVCPACAPRFMVTVKKYHEERYIRAQAMPGEKFREFVARIRGGAATVTVISR